MSDNVLVVAAHPDDEVLGCGATIARHTAAGDRVHILILADGVGARQGNHGNTSQTRVRAAEAAAAILRAEQPRLLDLPDNRLDSMPLLNIVQRVEAVMTEVQPKILYTHHAGDLNIDHRITHQAVMTACRPVPGASWRRILCFEVVSSTEWQTPSAADAFLPNWFVDATDTLSRKLDALQAYAAELRPWPHPRSLQALEHLARWRGATVGLDAAEAFMLARAID
ncbi:MAG: PIG-L family deacetylase [Gammaproteobacteria bacterium]|nr:PIG-L family deacetylase [Gammaproteobacteria bacterium]